jgi:hypothetical protein
VWNRTEIREIIIRRKGMRGLESWSRTEIREITRRRNGMRGFGDLS